jgi:membrane protein DedA with SNARE-associated domain
VAQILDGLRIWIEQVILGMGYPGIALLMFLENIFPPIPSEPVMVFSGFLVAQGRFSYLGILAAGTLGSLLGALSLYSLAAWADEPLIRRFLRRWGKYVFISEQDLNQALQVFDRHGQAAVLFGRLVPVIRSIVSIPAGIGRMPIGSFIRLTFLGALIWNGLLGYAGTVMGAQWEYILYLIDSYESVTLVVAAIAGAVFIASRLIRWRRQWEGNMLIKDRFTSLAEAILDAWRLSHGPDNASFTITTTPDRLTLRIEPAFTPAELQLAQDHQGNDLVRRYVARLFDSACAEQTASFEVSSGRAIISREVSVNPQAGWVSCIFNLEDRQTAENPPYPERIPAL